MAPTNKQSMRVPLQLALDFHSSHAKKANVSEVPIDKSFPENAANELAALESYNKHLYRPNTYLHKWWARRSGATFRYILKQLVDNPGKRDFYEGGGLEGKVIFDPMMGGGTTLHEAIRMGANVIGMDIDPIPVLQAKASLNQFSLKKKEAVFKLFFQALKEKLAPFYETDCPLCKRKGETQFALYGLRRRCSCREVIFVDSLIMRRGNQHDVHICQECHEVYTSETHTCLSQANSMLMVKGARQCELCHSDFIDILDEPFPERYVPLVNTGVCSEHGPFFKSVDQEDLLALNQALIHARHVEFGDLKNLQVSKGPKSKDLLRRGIRSFLDLFTPRQMLYLGASLDYLSGLSHDDRRWLALLVPK